MHTISVPSFCGIFVYRLVTSIVTNSVFFANFLRSMKLMKSVVSLMYDFCDCATGCSSLSRNAAILSVGPSQPEIIGRPTGFGLCIFVRV